MEQGGFYAVSHDANHGDKHTRGGGEQVGKKQNKTISRVKCGVCRQRKTMHTLRPFITFH